MGQWGRGRGGGGGQEALGQPWAGLRLAPALQGHKSTMPCLVECELNSGPSAL